MAIEGVAFKIARWDIPVEGKSFVHEVADCYQSLLAVQNGGRRFIVLWLKQMNRWNLPSTHNRVNQSLFFFDGPHFSPLKLSL